MDMSGYYQLYSNHYGNITDYPSNPRKPTTMSSGSGVHVIWVDDRDGNTELYYSQKVFYADMVLTNSDIQFDPPSPVKKGDPVFINASVYNYGISVTGVEVRFYDGNPDIDGDLIPDVGAQEIGNDTIDVNEGSSSIASIVWIPMIDGTYEIYVWVDPENLEQEYHETDNLAFNTTEVFSSGPSPPKNLLADLSPFAHASVNLMWNASIDDGGGDNDIAGYTVYKSSSGVNGSYEFVAWIPANGSLIYNWTDVGAGDGDLNDYFYMVRANDTSDNEELNLNKVGKVVNYLTEGWNLISIPLVQENTSREYVLQTLDSNYSAIQGYHAGKSRPWLHWHRDKPNFFNDIIEVNHEYGYYIDMLKADHLVVAGKVPNSPQISLTAGWNLVGYPSLTDRTSDDALSSISGMVNNVYFYNVTTDIDEVLGPFDTMNPEFGYWVHVTTYCVWEVPL